MYKRAREVAELLLLRYILNYLDTMDLMYVLATGQTSSLSKLMMQHEVTWLFRRSPRLHMVSSVITMDFQIAHCCRGWCGIFRHEHLTYISKCQTTTRGIEEVQFSWIGRKTWSVLQKDRRKYMDVERTGQKVLKYCKRENSNVWNVIHSWKEMNA